jgi:LmbE family N-acetylglucosaminyl deacetylase
MIDRCKDVLRLLCGAFFATALRLHSSVYTPRGPVVIIAPHPDDETLGCGGLIALLTCQGASVHVVFLTDGEASHVGHPDVTPATVGRMRRDEAHAALTLLARRALSPSAMFLGFPDGRLDRLSSSESKKLHTALAEIFRRVQPAAVFAPYRHGGSTEHTAASTFTRAACAAAGVAELLEYPIWAWWNPFRLLPQFRLGAENFRLPLDSQLRSLKRAALACHRTQVEPTLPWPNPLLPTAIVHACLGRSEFFFRQFVPASPPRASLSP